MKKIIDYIKNNKFYVFVMIIGTVLFSLQMKYVTLYADDFTLGVISKKGIKAMLTELKGTYLGWGGGPTPFIAEFFLMFRIGVWKVFNIIMIVTSIILFVRMITHNSKINKGIIATIMWLLIFVLNISISRETIYWVDGNLAYVLTAFQMLIYFYYLYSRIVMKTSPKKYDFVLLMIVAFFAGWTGPQAGATTVIIPFLLFIWVRFIKKEKIKPTYLVSYVFAIVGFLVYLLAPGNNARLEAGFPEIAKLNIFERVGYRLDSVFDLMFNQKKYGFASIPFYLFLSIGLMSIISIKKCKEKTENSRKHYIYIYICGAILISFLGICLASTLNISFFPDLGDKILRFHNVYTELNSGEFSVLSLIPYIVACFVLLISVILSFYISYKEKNPLLVISYTCAILGQIMMLASPYSPLRTTFITVFLLWLCIGILISIILKEKINIFWIFTIVLAITYDSKILLINTAIYFIINSIFDIKDKNYKVEFSMILIIFMVISSWTYYVTIDRYRENSKIYYENIIRLNNYEEFLTEENILYLKRPKYDAYGFGGFVGANWVKNSVKNYFELDENVILEYED